MARKTALSLWVATVALAVTSLHAQSAQQIIQQVVDSERTADRNDHSNWIYLEESDKPKEHLLQWVAGTQRGNVERILEKDDKELSEAQQQELIQKFLHDPKAQNKQMTEASHDNQQIRRFIEAATRCLYLDPNRRNCDPPRRFTLILHPVFIPRAGRRGSSAA